jgi:hypothetical protein
LASVNLGLEGLAVVNGLEIRSTGLLWIRAAGLIFLDSGENPAEGRRELPVDFV